MGTSNKFDRLQDKMNQTSQSLSDQASAIADSAETPSEPLGATNVSLASSDSAVGTSVSSGNAEVAAAAKQTPESAYANESAEVKTIIRHLEYYALEAAGNKRITRTELIALQTTFARNLEQLVNLTSNGDFAVCFKRLLTLVRENRTGAFSINNLNRCVSSLSKGNTYVENYTKFLDMVITFADPTMRTVYIRRYNLAAGAQFAKADKRERLIEFIRSISGVN